VDPEFEAGTMTGGTGTGYARTFVLSLASERRWGIGMI